jgi:membrane-bound metal-dependent hydrolase YbcI (DUF457 family)
MANFTTHIAVGTVVTGALATVTLAADVVAPENLIAVTLAGMLGSVLPDIDLKDSRPSQAFFSGLAVFLSFIVLFNMSVNYSIAEMWLAWLGTLLMVRYGAHAIFHRMSYHRGIYHSILAAVFFAVLTAVVYRYLLGRHEGVAWLAGGFMLVGYLTHLILDEIYSVDIMDRRIKASFGSAIKLLDLRKPAHSLAMAAATALTIYVAPSPQVFLEGVSSQPMWLSLQERLLPEERWFGVFAIPGREVGPGRTSATATAPAAGGANERAAGAPATAEPAATEPAAAPVHAERRGTSGPVVREITTGTIPAREPTPAGAPWPK